MLKRRRPIAADRRTKEEPYRDRRGLAFAEYHRWLPASTHDWPSPPRDRNDPRGLQAKFKAEHTTCWWCGRSKYSPVRDPVPIDLHHLAEGSRGKANERELFASACRTCHERHVGEADLGRWLFLKWERDPEWCDWTWLALRLRKFLPPLITDATPS